MACIPYGTTKQEAVFSDLSMYGLVPLGALVSHYKCGSCSPEFLRKVLSSQLSTSLASVCANSASTCRKFSCGAR